jgi:hypothetical protein
MKEMGKSYIQKKINKLNKKIHRAESQREHNKAWWRKLKLSKLKDKLKSHRLISMKKITFFLITLLTFSCSSIKFSNDYLTSLP